MPPSRRSTATPARSRRSRQGRGDEGARRHRRPRGVDAVYKLAPIIADTEALNVRLPSDPFLDKGTVTVSWVDCKSPSFNAVPDVARIVLDRRLTVGETAEKALAEFRSLPHVGDSDVRVLRWEGRSWTGAPVTQEQVFPAWVLPEEHPVVGGVAAAVEAVLGRRPAISMWPFSTNGVATMGRLGIPTVGFAPGCEELAHTTGEWVAVEDLVKATAACSLIPQCLTAPRDVAG